MIRTVTLLQPNDGRIVDLLHQAAADERYESLDAAVAYATQSGVTTLRSRAVSVDRLQCRWLSAFDWCRSDPVALESLGQPTGAGTCQGL